MQEGDFLFFNDKFLRSGKPIISANDRSFRYADGVFETMRVHKGSILLKDLHMERLFSSLYQLKYQLPSWLTALWVEQQVLSLVQKNSHASNARIRLTITRGDGGLHEAPSLGPQVLIQSWPLPAPPKQLNENGLELGICLGITKPADSYAAIKSSNFLPYVVAAQWAREQRLNDAILLNPYGRVADTTIANLFIVHEGKVCTPALTEGPVNGVMRKRILHILEKNGIPHEQTAISPDLLREAAEVWISNAIMGIKWVKQVGDWGYASQTMASSLLQQIW